MSTAKEECESLMGAVIEYADQLLRLQGAFLPFGSGMTAEGEIVAIAGHDGRDNPPSQDLIRLLQPALQTALRDGSLRATALAYDVRVELPSSGKKSDAIAIELNHQGDYAVIVFRPYEIVRGRIPLLSKPQIRYGDIFAQQPSSTSSP